MMKPAMRQRFLTVAFTAILSLHALAAAPPAADTAQMESAPFRVADSYPLRHDIVYQAPMQLEAEGFPLGNGDMGGLVWTHDDGIEFQIHKNDVWSNPEPGSSARVPRHLARLKIDFGMPVFSWIHHMNDFEGRLSLAKGEASFRARTAFATTAVKTWLAQDRNVWVVECDNAFNPKLNEEVQSQARVTLERIGSRAFNGWYAGGFPRDPASGIGNTRTQAVGDDLVVLENADGMNFAVACRILGAHGQPMRISNHRIEGMAKEAKFTVLVAVATAEEAPDPKAAALALLEASAKDGVAKLKAQKDDWFAKFWQKSFVHLGDDYLENHWYLRRYLAGCGSRGKYPLIFNGGLWRWNRDVTNWVTPHHWNTQQQYWGLCAANDCDLMKPYLDTYWRMAQKPGMARLAARRGAPKDAILLSEMHNFDGTLVDPDRGDMKNAFTQAAQVASRFWETCTFTGDKEFLAKEAYPFMKRAANFYLEKLRWDAKRNAYTITASNYEDGGGRGPVRDPESDRECIEALFKSCLAASAALGTDADMAPKWQHVLDHLWTRRLIKAPPYPGEVVAADEAGKYGVGAWALGGAPAFPSGNIGIDDKDTPVGKAVANYIHGTKEMYSHHPTPVIAARMGMGDDALRLLKDGIGEMQYFPSGLMFNCRGYPSKLYDLDLKVNLIGGPGRPTIKWRDFFQCGMETTSICATAMTEMMLQSNEGKIRVFPALPAEWKDKELAFKLLARGGFLVAAERRKGEVVQVGVKSLHGGTCRVQNPFAEKPAEVLAQDSGAKVETTRDAAGVLSFATRAGREYILRPAGAKPEAPETFASEPNKAPKKSWGARMLGIGRGFTE